MQLFRAKNATTGEKFMKLTDMEMAHSVELEIMHDGKKTTLLTTVEGIIDNHVLLTPIHIDGKVVGFPIYLTVNLLYPENGKVFCWSNVAIKAVRYQGNIYHCVNLVGNAIVLNRRGAYRVYIGETKFIYHRNHIDTKMYEVFLRDISETGMCYMSKDHFEVGKTVHLQLRFANGHELTLRAKILWKRENPNRSTTFLYGCKFTEKNKFLSSYLMNVQQEHQRKKLGRK